jgi:hypothetical protein
MTQAQVKSAIEAAQEYTVEPPRPLMREMPPADPFPIDALSPILREATLAIHDIVQAPMAICAQSVIAAAAHAVQGHADIRLAIGQTKPLSCYFATIADSGERKSTVDAQATWPIRKREAALRDQYDTDRERWNNEREAWETQRKQVLNDKKAYPDKALKAGALNELGPPPPEPLIPMLVCQEPTLEGLIKLFANGHPSLGIFSAEGGQFIGGHGMSEEAKLRTATGLSQLWDGEDLKRVRATDGATTLSGRRLSVHLMIQPAVADILLKDSLLNSQGMLSRMLVSAPASAAGRRMHREPSPDSEAVIKRYGAQILSILERGLPLAEGKRNQLIPRVLEMTPEARHLWFQFADHIESQLAHGGDLEPIKGLANKIPEHAARLAAVIALTENIDAIALDEPFLRMGIRLAEHYLKEALRVYATGNFDPDLILAQQTLEWIKEQNKEFICLSDLYQRGPSKIREVKVARKIARILKDHGYLIPAKQPVTLDGVKRKEVWRINS